MLVAVSLSACGSRGPATRHEVLVDYHEDRFAAVVAAFLPDTVSAHPGDVIHFHQTWNGEPHTVTMGTLVETALKAFDPVLPKLAAGEQGDPEVNAHFASDFAHVPAMVDFPDTTKVLQTGAQPCFLDQGVPPTDGTPCAKRAQPSFDGRQALYSSGFIPYSGTSANTFDVHLAADIAPGTYRYFCTYHGPAMQGRIVVRPRRVKVPGRAAVAHAAVRQEADRARAAYSALTTATSGRFDTIRAAAAAHLAPVPPDVASQVRGDYFAGYGYEGPGAGPAGFFDTNEFVPHAITTRVGEKVTWLFVGNHTVSFDVPRYFPQFAVADDGRVRFDHRADAPVGGPGFPASPPSNPPPLFVVDGGTWNGRGFRSSGLPGELTEQDVIAGFSLTFTRPGSYTYACLIHPRMVGTVVVHA